MKIKVSHNSVELKLTLEELNDLQYIIDIAELRSVDEALKLKANRLSERLNKVKEAANKLNWMDGISNEN